MRPDEGAGPGASAARVLVALLALAAATSARAATASTPPAACEGLPAAPAQVADRFVAAVKAGEPPASLHDVCIVATLRLSRPVDGPFVLRDSVLAGGLDARSASFLSIVDLSGTTIVGRADFSSAEFGREAEFGSATFEHGATFTAAEFHGAAVFASATFAGEADFRSVSFDRGTDFTAARFQRAASFEKASLAQQSRFTAAEFMRDARFDAAQFNGGCDFSSVTFDGVASYALITSRGDLGFQRAKFRVGEDDPLGVTFQQALVTGTADFSDAGSIASNGVFDDAVIGSLVFAGAEARLFGTPIRIDELRIDPGAVDAIEFTGEARAKVAKYALLETAAGNGGDLAAANEARVLRLGLLRQSEALPVRALDWAFYWGVAGYFVRPSHPALALVALFLAGIAARAFHNRRERAGAGGHLRGVLADGRGAFGAFKQIRPRDSRGLALAEYFAYAVLSVLLLVNLEGVSPRIHEIVQELLP